MVAEEEEEDKEACIYKLYTQPGEKQIHQQIHKLAKISNEQQNTCLEAISWHDGTKDTLAEE